MVAEGVMPECLLSKEKHTSPSSSSTYLSPSLPLSVNFAPLPSRATFQKFPNSIICFFLRTFSNAKFQICCINRINLAVTDFQTLSSVADWHGK